MQSQIPPKPVLLRKSRARHPTLSPPPPTILPLVRPLALNLRKRLALKLTLNPKTSSAPKPSQSPTATSDLALRPPTTPLPIAPPNGRPNTCRSFALSAPRLPTTLMESTSGNGCPNCAGVPLPIPTLPDTRSPIPLCVPFPALLPVRASEPGPVRIPVYLPVGCVSTPHPPEQSFQQSGEVPVVRKRTRTAPKRS